MDTIAVTQLNVLNKSLSAGHWFLLDVFFQKILIYGSFFITARYISPEAYGLIALATIYPALIESLSAIAFDVALTQKKSGEEKPYLDSVWTFNLMRVFFVGIIVFISAPYVAHFFHSENALLLFQLSALPVFLQSLSNIGQIYFFRNMELKKVFIRDMINYGVTAIITITLAITMRSYWALFLGTISGIACAALSTYFLSTYRPRIDLQFKKLKPLLKYSEWVFGQGLVHRLSQTLEDTLTGYYTNATSVGLYSKAKSLAYAPISPLGNIMNKIGFSAIVAVQDSPVYIREGFNKSFEIATAISLPFMVGIWIAGETLVYAVLGGAWINMTPLLTTLVIVAALNAMFTGIATTVLNALNKPQHIFRLNLLGLACAILFLPTLIIIYGIQGAALALLCSSIITNIYAIHLLQKFVLESWERAWKAFAVTLLSLLPSSFISIFLLQFTFTKTLVGLLMTALCMGLLYVMMLMIFGKIYKQGPWGTLAVVIQSFRGKHV